MPLKGKDGGTWKDASAVYGKSGDTWLYAKYAMAKKDGEWERAWTDCRKLGAEGGRDWLPTTLPAVYSGSCGNRTYQIPTRYSKDGCPYYDVPGTTIADPNCNKYDTNCYNSATGAYEYRYSCSSRESRIVYTFTPKSGTSCGTQYEYTNWVSDPNCGAVGTSCWTNITCNYLSSTNFVFNGVFYTGVFSAGSIGGAPEDCFGYNDGPCWDSFWSCGSNIGTTSFCFS